MNLSDKIEVAQVWVEECLQNYKKPIIACSFGKDSLVVLHLTRQLGYKLPVLLHREPFYPAKYSFANQVIEAWDLTVYDYSPSSTSVLAKNGEVEITNYYQVGEKALVWLPTGIKPPIEGESFLCGYEDIYNKPIGTFKYPWDLLFLGHKSSDVDPILGPVPLAYNVRVVEGGPTCCYPLRYFTDQDVWDYTIRFNLPINTRRYNRADGWKEFKDITFNNDYFQACTACMVNKDLEQVFCPKLGQLIPNRYPEIKQTIIPTAEQTGVEHANL